MRITIDSTEELTRIDGVECRIWRGVTERGVHCYAFIHRIAVRADQDVSQFQRELVETKQPSSQAAQAVAIDLRKIL